MQVRKESNNRPLSSWLEAFALHHRLCSLPRIMADLLQLLTEWSPKFWSLALKEKVTCVLLNSLRNSITCVSSTVNVQQQSTDSWSECALPQLTRIFHLRKSSDNSSLQLVLDLISKSLLTPYSTLVLLYKVLDLTQSTTMITMPNSLRILGDSKT